MKSIISFLALIFVTSSCSETAKPNIVFLFVDDLAYDAVAAYGNKVVKTPNMDRLATKGTRFTNAYNMGSWSGAVCTASRSMLISGMSVWRANQNRQKWHQNDSVSIAQSWGRLMKNQGYETYMTGKWHVDLPADSVFDNVVHVRAGMPRDAYPAAKVNKNFALYKNGELSYNELMPNGYNRPLSVNDKTWSPTDTSKGGFWEGGKHWSEVLVDDTFSFNQKAKQSENPFFMYLAFNAAHDPRQAPQEYIDMYPLDEIEVPVNFTEDYFLHQEIGLGPTLRDEALAPFPRTEYAIKVHLQEYYALISHLDVQIGRILQALEDNDMMDNTYVFLTADHGLAIGSHGLMGKQNMYDHSIRVPMMVMGPAIPKGKEVSADVYLQDVMATSLEIAGVGIPSFVEFKSLLGLVNATEKSSYPNGIYGAYLNKQRMIRKDDFKLIVYPDAKRMLLYDLKNDPYEMKDLNGLDDYKEKQQSLLLDLIEMQRQLDDTLDITSFVN